MKKYITLWTDKGHTRKKITSDVLQDSMLWSEERLASPQQYMVLINPILKTIRDGKKQFQASIQVSHRNLTYKGRVWEQNIDGRLEMLGDQNIGHTIIYGDIRAGQEFNIHIYSGKHKPIQDWMLTEGYQVFISARDEFMQLFRPDEEDHPNNS
jgi:hypothetical protein